MMSISVKLQKIVNRKHDRTSKHLLFAVFVYKCTDIEIRRYNQIYLIAEVDS